jgi:nucleoside-diphosphate-sugar epimerase
LARPETSKQVGDCVVNIEPFKFAVVTGAGGFIGSHLVKALKQQGYYVRGVDIKFPDFEPSSADDFQIADLRDYDKAKTALYGADIVYALAANMGGIGYITTQDAEILMDNLLISINTVRATENFTSGKILYSSSACIYPEYAQLDANVAPLREDMDYPADPNEGYGWEKLTTERLLLTLSREDRVNCRIARLHNIYGPLGTWRGGKEKAPAALCRKIAEAGFGGEIEVWGDGKQTRSYCYIDDCVEGLLRLAASDYEGPVNLGSDELVSVDELIDIISKIANKSVTKKYVTGPVGVRGRNSDNTLIKKVLGWAPSTSLEDGLFKTYEWINEQVWADQP